jgi:hypothetical protein
MLRIEDGDTVQGSLADPAQVAYYSSMGVRLAAAAGCWQISSGLAEPDRAPVLIKPAAMPEKGLQLPFDLGTPA